MDKSYFSSHEEGNGGRERGVGTRRLIGRDPNSFLPKKTIKPPGVHAPKSETVSFHGRQTDRVFSHALHVCRVGSCTSNTTYSTKLDYWALQTLLENTQPNSVS